MSKKRWEKKRKCERWEDRERRGKKMKKESYSVASGIRYVVNAFFPVSLLTALSMQLKYTLFHKNPVEK